MERQIAVNDVSYLAKTTLHAFGVVPSETDNVLEKITDAIYLHIPFLKDTVLRYNTTNLKNQTVFIAILHAGYMLKQTNNPVLFVSTVSQSVSIMMAFSMLQDFDFPFQYQCKVLCDVQDCLNRGKLASNVDSFATFKYSAMVSDRVDRTTHTNIGDMQALCAQIIVQAQGKIGVMSFSEGIEKDGRIATRPNRAKPVHVMFRP